mmetsp:Transcript_17317/g.51669  ORF Transcript_17317/g.51669 Transcript_17317/m.51669 type:complete len:211 (-) Transcript_17317:26-658(-)
MALRLLALLSTALFAAAYVPPAAPLRRHTLRRAEPVVSPFEQAAAEIAADGPAGDVPFDAASVDAVLEQVRPYLISDGGNVEVVSADPATKDVVLRLQGACGSCASSTVTMKQGIERVLRERWPDLGAVTRDDDPENQVLSEELVEELLAPLTNAVSKLGATVTIVSAGHLAEKTVELAFTGPDTVKKGIEFSLLDSPLINKIEWVDFDV